MQTFLAYPSFSESARVLDNRRLLKQLVECQQILKVLSGLAKCNERTGRVAWVNHPAVKMWKGHTWVLLMYALEIENERAKRFPDRVHASARWLMTITFYFEGYELPIWLGDPAFHASHRSNLLRKDPVWYGKFGWTEGPDLPYVWPSKE